MLKIIGFQRVHIDFWKNPTTNPKNHFVTFVQCRPIFEVPVGPDLCFFYIFFLEGSDLCTFYDEILIFNEQSVGAIWWSGCFKTFWTTCRAYVLFVALVILFLKFLSTPFCYLVNLFLLAHSRTPTLTNKIKSFTLYKFLYCYPWVSLLFLLRVKVNGIITLLLSGNE